MCSLVTLLPSFISPGQSQLTSPPSGDVTSIFFPLFPIYFLDDLPFPHSSPSFPFRPTPLYLAFSSLFLFSFRLQCVRILPALSSYSSTSSLSRVQRITFPSPSISVAKPVLTLCGSRYMDRRPRLYIHFRILLFFPPTHILRPGWLWTPEHRQN